MEESLSFLMDKASRALIYRLQNRFVKSGFDITVEQAVIMAHLWRENGSSQQKIANSLGKDKATVSGIITSLEKKNLIVRVPGETDKGQRRIFLTEAGRKLESKLEPIIHENLEYAEKSIRPEDITTCKAVLKTIITRLKT